MSKLNIVEAMSNRRLFEPWFRGPSWDGWKGMLKAAHGIPMRSEEIKLFQKLAERDPPRRQVREFWVCGGRRLGKDSIASLSTGHAAAFFDGDKKLRRGERALFLSLACSRDQGRIALEYTRSYFGKDGIRPLQAMIERETRDGLELSNATEIAVGTNDFRGVRGRAIARAILSEVAFYKSDDSATPDIETYRAILPAMSTIDDAMLLGISSPHAKSGLLWQKFCEHYGRNDEDVLFIKAPTIELNPTVDRRLIEKAIAEDPDAANAEWNALFREGVSGLIGSEALRRVIVPDRKARKPERGQSYVCFVDGASGVVGGDSFCAAWAHLDKTTDRAILDQIYERRPPFNADDCIYEITAICRQYGCDRVIGDAWAGDLLRQRWVALTGASYEVSNRSKSQIYLDWLPLVSSMRVEMLDDDRAVQQALGLERRATRGSNREIVDHNPQTRDDRINAIAGALVHCADVGDKITWSLNGYDLSAPLPPNVPAVCDDPLDYIRARVLRNGAHLGPQP